MNYSFSRAQCIHLENEVILEMDDLQFWKSMNPEVCNIHEV